MHLLLVEDDLDLGSALLQSLQAEGMSCEWVRSATDARAFVLRGGFDCALLDLGLPDGDGLALLTQWRSQGLALPLIVITARSALETRLAGLDGGADDFLLKPFAPAELVARIHAVMRRSLHHSHQVWHLGRLRIEPQRHRVHLDDKPVDLSPREFSLLLQLAQAGGEVVAKHRLASRLEPLGDPLDFATLEVHVSNLRRKLGPGLIHTLRGVGYRLDTEPPC